MLQKLKHTNPAKFFVIAAIFFELLLNLVTPPLQAPDEFSHFYRAYQVSEGYFLPVKQNQRLGGYVPQGMVDFTDQYKQPAYILNYTLTHREVLRSFKISLQEQNRRFVDFANTAYYAPVSYLPQALAIFILRLFHAPPALLYYGGRLFAFFAWLLCMYFFIRRLPAFKWLFTALLLLPMNVYVANSISADTVTNILSFLFIGQVLQHIFVTKVLTAKHFVSMGTVLVLLVLAKVVYIGLIILLLAIPAAKFKSRVQRLAGLALLLALPAGLFMLWSGTVMSLYIPFKDYNPEFRSVACLSPCGDYYAQQQYILSHGFYFFKVAWHSLVNHPRTYLSGYVGVFGNGDISLPLWLYVVSYTVVILVALLEQNNFSLSLRQKWLALAAAAFAFVLLLLSQHLIWDCVGEGVVDLLQGRYLIPIFPLLFLLIPSSVWRFQMNLLWPLAFFIALLYAYSGKKIYQRFFVGPPAQVKELYCDAEQTDAYGSFKTSDAGAWLGNAANRSSQEHRSGNYSAKLCPTAAFCFTYKFKGLHKGDLLEAEAWQKGEGALLVFSGKEERCGDFYFAGTFNGQCDKQGWRRIRTVCEATFDCDHAEMAFYAWNPQKTCVYLDDIKITIKKLNSRPD